MATEDIPDDRTSVSTFAVMNERSQAILHRVLKVPT